MAGRQTMARERTLSRLSEMFKRENLGDDRKSNKSLSHRYTVYNKKQPNLNYSRFGLNPPDPKIRKKISSSFHGNEEPPLSGDRSKDDRKPIMFDDLESMMISNNERKSNERSKSTQKLISKHSKLKEKKPKKIKKKKSSEEDESRSLSMDIKDDTNEEEEEEEQEDSEEQETPIVNRRVYK